MRAGDRDLSQALKVETTSWKLLLRLLSAASTGRAGLIAISDSSGNQECTANYGPRSKQAPCDGRPPALHRGDLTARYSHALAGPRLVVSA